jgi:hypothetical protein
MLAIALTTKKEVAPTTTRRRSSRLALWRVLACLAIATTSQSEFEVQTDLPLDRKRGQHVRAAARDRAALRASPTAGPPALPLASCCRLSPPRALRRSAGNRSGTPLPRLELIHPNQPPCWPSAAADGNGGLPRVPPAPAHLLRRTARAERPPLEQKQARNVGRRNCSCEPAGTDSALELCAACGFGVFGVARALLTSDRCERSQRRRNRLGRHRRR